MEYLVKFSVDPFKEITNENLTIVNLKWYWKLFPSLEYILFETKEEEEEWKRLLEV